MIQTWRLHSRLSATVIITAVSPHLHLERLLHSYSVRPVVRHLWFCFNLAWLGNTANASNLSQTPAERPHLDPNER